MGSMIPSQSVKHRSERCTLTTTNRKGKMRKILLLIALVFSFQIIVLGAPEEARADAQCQSDAYLGNGWWLACRPAAHTVYTWSCPWGCTVYQNHYADRYYNGFRPS